MAHDAPACTHARTHLRAVSVMFMHNPRLAEVRKAMDNSDLLGAVKR